MQQKPLTVLVLFGTRPELIKLAPVVERLSGDERFRPIVVATSQHREMLAGHAELFRIVPDFDLDVIRPEQTLADISRRTLAALDAVVHRERPDLVLVQGDTTSAFIGGLTAFYHRVPVAHVEAGLRSGDRDHPYPEEVNRRLLSVLAELHLAPLASNERNLLDEGVDPEAIHVTGNTVIDALTEIRRRGGGALDRFVDEAALAGRRLVLVTAHRRESFDRHLAELCDAVVELAERYPDLVVVYPLHLNPRVRREVLPRLGGHDRVLLVEPLPYDAFVEAIARSHLVITDSGGVQEEAPALGKPVLVFREVTERGEGVAARGSLVVGRERDGVVAAAARLLDDDAAYAAMATPRTVFGDGRAAERIVDAILHHFGRGDRPERFEEQPVRKSTVARPADPTE